MRVVASRGLAGTRQLSEFDLSFALVTQLCFAKLELRRRSHEAGAL